MSQVNSTNQKLNIICDWLTFKVWVVEKCTNLVTNALTIKCLFTAKGVAIVNIINNVVFEKRIQKSY